MVTSAHPYRNEREIRDIEDECAFVIDVNCVNLEVFDSSRDIDPGILLDLLEQGVSEISNPGGRFQPKVLVRSRACIQGVWFG